MRKLLSWAWIAALFAVVPTSCRKATMKLVEPARQTGRWVIFNPDPLADANTSYVQGEWPSTDAPGVYDEQVILHEEVEDIQSRRPIRFETPYRRVTSVRVGRFHR